MRVEGVDRLLRQMQQLGGDYEKAAKGEVQANARLISSEAKKKAPANFGKLKQSIGPEKTPQTKGLNWSIVARESYAAYVEFGTGIKVDVPVEMAEIAQQFKGGSTGNFDEFLDSIKDWADKKGIKPNIGVDPDQYDYEQMYYLIAVSILNNGLRPQPYLYPAWKENKDKLLPALQNAFDTITRRFNNAH